MKSQDQIKHLYNRAGFGLSFNHFDEGRRNSLTKIFTNAANFTPLNVIEKPAPKEKTMGEMDEKMKAQNRMARRQDIVFLNTSWTKQLYTTDNVLREKMTLIWHNHFACRVQVPYAAQVQNNTLRKYALGKFGDLLMAISKNPAMLYFLNNQQNKKDSPNENFAREVLELFTLGRGHYTEKDIKEAARAFTGWGANSKGEFVFGLKVHDEGLKTFRGKSGNFTGEDILGMILEDKQTAKFIIEKLWRHLISTEARDEEIILALSKSFYKTDYDIQKLLQEIYTSDWFYEDRFVGNLIKSPMELISGILTHTGGQFENPDSMVYIQRTLGQVLFAPPNVGGWPMGKEWVDSSSLTFRMSLPNILFKKTSIDIKAKDDGDVNNATNKANASKLSFLIDWHPLAQRFSKATAVESLKTIEDYLLARPTSAHNMKWVENFTAKNLNEVDFVKKAFIGFMSLPEYQLC